MPLTGVEVVDPCSRNVWDDLIAPIDGVSFFHGRAWAEVLSLTYGYRPFYLLLRSGRDPVGLLSLMEVRSPLTGNRGVSLPFSDLARVLAPDEAGFAMLFERAKAIAAERGWRSIELRGAPFPPETPAAESYLEHVLILDREEKDLYRALHVSTRRNIEKARKENLELRFTSGLEEMKVFYRMHCKTRRDHGLPPQPWRFFREIHNRVIAPGQGILATAVSKGAPAAGAVFFFYRNQVLYKFGASEKRFLSLRPNNLVFWEAIRRFREQGFRSLHFGRTDKENEGLARFKRSWGAKEGEIRYHRFEFKRACFVEKRNGAPGFSSLFRRLPIPALRLIGSLLYKHVG